MEVSIAGLRVLVVEDHADSLDLLAELLEIEGADVRKATSADRAMHVLAKWLPDVLVSNIAMPREDGCHLLQRVRALSAEQGGSVPAIAVTGYVRSEDRLRAEAAGFDAYLPKPIDPVSLRRTIAKAVLRGERIL